MDDMNKFVAKNTDRENVLLEALMIERANHAETLVKLSNAEDELQHCKSSLVAERESFFNVSCLLDDAERRYKEYDDEIASLKEEIKRVNKERKNIGKGAEVNALINQNMAKERWELNAKITELSKLSEHDNGVILLGWMDAHKKAMDRLTKTENRLSQVLMELDYEKMHLANADDMNKSLLHRYLKCKEVIVDLLDSAEYWSEYDVPLGIVKRMKEAIR